MKDETPASDLNTPHASGEELKILVIGRHHDIVQTIVRLLNSQHNWKADGALRNAEAAQLFRSGDYQIVLLGGGVDEESEKELSKEFTSFKPSVKIIQHFGGGSGLLFNEIFEALNKKKLKL